MKRVRLSNKIRKTLRGSSRGVTLIEVLVALALFAIIGIAFAGGLGTASRAVFTADVRTNAESLARSQMEYVKTQDYDSAGNYTLLDLPEYEDAGYLATLDPPPLVLEEGLQKITVTISHEGRQVIALEGYKVNR
jgi:prepilin-type N-terminal cleavage/methylation domain-containing protein